MNLWDGDVWSFVLTLSMLFAAMIAATILRNTFAPVRTRWNGMTTSIQSWASAQSTCASLVAT